MTGSVSDEWRYEKGLRDREVGRMTDRICKAAEGGFDEQKSRGMVVGDCCFLKFPDRIAPCPAPSACSFLRFQNG